MSKLQKFMQLTKVDVAKKLIYGVFTAEQIDKSGEIADYETTKQAIQEWSADIQKISGGKSLGNIRKMHGKEVVGKAVSIDFDDVAKVIHGVVEADDQTIQQADKGLLNGFSIGGSYAKRWPDPVHKNVNRFTPVISEISVVDNPCVPDAVFTMVKDATFEVVKEDGTTELKKFADQQPLEMKLEQVWQADDGSTFKTKQEAVTKNAQIAADKAAQAVFASLKKADEAVSSVEKREFTQAERDKAADSGAALPDGSFPIKTKEDLHNAIQAFGRAKDKRKAKAHIKARAKALGAEDQLPDTWKSMLATDLKKGLETVGRIACIVQELHWIAECVAFEEYQEEDDKSILPNEIKDSVLTLCNILEAMVQEEVQEIREHHEDEDYVEAAAGMKDASGIRKLAKNDKLFPGCLTPAHAGRSSEKPNPEALQKLTAERDALQKILADLPAQIDAKFDTLVKRIKVLESQPMPDKVILSTVVKGGDTDVVEKAENKTEFKADTTSPAVFARIFNR